MVISLNYCSQNGGNVYRAPYYNRNPNIGPRTIGNLDQYPYIYIYTIYSLEWWCSFLNIGIRVSKIEEVSLNKS